MRIFTKVLLAFITIVTLFSGSILNAQVKPTPYWINFYGSNSMLNGKPVAVGTVIRAYDSNGVQCGTYVVNVAGRYGFMACYFDDPTTMIDEGIRPGDTVRFTVDGSLAGSVAIPIGMGNGQRIEFNFAITTIQEVPSCIDAYETNDKHATAKWLTDLEAHTFLSKKEGWDQDWAKFNAKANWTYQIKARSNQPLSIVHPILRLYDEEGNLIEENSMDKWGRGAEIWWWNGGDEQTMYIQVEEAEGRYGCLHYALMAKPWSPDQMKAQFGQ